MDRVADDQTGDFLEEKHRRCYALTRLPGHANNAVRRLCAHRTSRGDEASALRFVTLRLDREEANL